MKIIYFILFLSIFLNAQTLKNLKLDDALKLLKKNNLEVNIAKLKIYSKEFDLNNVEAKNYGKLDLSINALRSNDAGNVFGFKLKSREASFADFGFDGFLAGQANSLSGAQILALEPEKLNNPRSINHFQSELQYSLPIYTGGKISSYKAIAKDMLKMAKLDKTKLLHEKIFQTKQVFFNISLLNTYILNLKKITNNITKLEKTVQSMLEEGYAKKVDLLEVQAKKANVLRMLNKSQENKSLSYQFLSFLLDKKVDSINHEFIPKAITPKLKNQKVDNNIDIQKAKLGVKISNTNQKLNMSNFLPTLGAFAKYGVYSDEILANISTKDAYTVGLALKLNIFNGGADKSNYEQAKIESLKASSNLELAKKGISLKISKILTQIKSLNFDIESLEKELNYAQEIYKNYNGRYEEHLVSIGEVLIKQSTQLQKLIELNKIKNERNVKVFQLERLIGEQK